MGIGKYKIMVWLCAVVMILTVITTVKAEDKPITNLFVPELVDVKTAPVVESTPFRLHTPAHQLEQCIQQPSAPVLVRREYFDLPLSTLSAMPINQLVMYDTPTGRTYLKGQDTGMCGPGGCSTGSCATGMCSGSSCSSGMCSSGACSMRSSGGCSSGSCSSGSCGMMGGGGCNSGSCGMGGGMRSGSGGGCSSGSCGAGGGGSGPFSWFRPFGGVFRRN